MKAGELMGINVSYVVAFFNGLISFFTPCILPLLPVYFGYLAGEALADLNDKNVKRKLIINALGFVLGITLLNVLLGFGAKALTAPLMEYGYILRIIGGILMILFGLYFISGLKFMFIERERKIQYKKFTPNFLKSFLLGIAFSFGWTPCNGPIIGSILIIASFEQNYLKAGSLMLVYSLGFAIMFLLSALLIGFFLEKSKKIYRYFNIIKIVAGIIMILMGILLLMNKLTIFNGLL